MFHHFILQFDRDKYVALLSLNSASPSRPQFILKSGTRLRTNMHDLQETISPRRAMHSAVDNQTDSGILLTLSL
jgi:hypothetical protein